MFNEGLLVIRSTGNLWIKMTERKLTLGFTYVVWVTVQSWYKSETESLLSLITGTSPREHIPRI